MLKLSSAQAEQFKSIGAYLRSKRLEKTLSLEDIAAVTMIRIAILQALETGNLEQLPELVYVKGFIRRYGEVLKIDGNALANSISAIAEPEVVETPEEPKTVAVHPVPKKVATPEPAPVAKMSVTASKPVPVAKTIATPEPVPAVRTSPSVATSSGSKSSLPYILLGIGALGLASLGYFFWRPQPTPTTTSQPNTTDQTSPVVAPPPPPAPIQRVAQPSPSPVPTPVVSASPSPVASPSTLSITLKLDDRSWLEIFVDGQLAYRGILEAGAQKTWMAKKTFNIKTGNAGAVKMTVNDKPAQPLGKLGEVKEVTLTTNAQSANGTVNQN